MGNKRKFGDRKDAKRVRDIDGLSQILLDLKPKRSLGEVYIKQKFDVTKFVSYMKKIKEKDENISYFHGFTTLIGKTMYNRPKLNRFVANRHVYEHNEITLSYVMKQKFDDKSEEIMVLLPIKENDNIFTISKRTNEKVDSVRNHNDTGDGANNAIQILGKLPNFLRVPIVGIFKGFDKKGWLPSSLVKDNIYYSSILVSNLGSLHCDGIYHNITDFGTASGLITMGEVKEEIITENNKEIKKYYCNFGITLDERIADGFYMIRTMQLMQYIFDNPELLEENANEKIEIKE